MITQPSLIGLKLSKTTTVQSGIDGYMGCDQVDDYLCHQLKYPYFQYDFWVSPDKNNINDNDKIRSMLPDFKDKY